MRALLDRLYRRRDFLKLFGKGLGYSAAATLSACGGDGGGNDVEAPAREPSPAIPQASSEYRILKRTSFGVHRDALAAIKTPGSDAYLEQQLDYTQTDDGNLEASIQTLFPQTTQSPAELIGGFPDNIASVAEQMVAAVICSGAGLNPPADSVSGPPQLAGGRRRRSYTGSARLTRAARCFASAATDSRSSPRIVSGQARKPHFQGFALPPLRTLPIYTQYRKRDFSLPRRKGGIPTTKETVMPNSAYKVIDVVGTSETSWEDAAQRAIAVAGESIHNLRIAEVVKLDMKIEDGKVAAYRSRLNLSFKIEL